MRVVIADDSVLVREGIASLVRGAGIEVAAQTSSAQALIDVVGEHRPDVAIVDIRMPPTYTDEGARAAREIKATHPDVGVLVLSQHIETTHAVELVTLGGFGYLLKDRVLEVAEFLSAAQRVADGGSALDPQVVARLLSARAQDDPLDDLTPREHEVLELMAQGLTNVGIAKRLFLSERTVEAHVRHVLLKLGVPEGEDAHRRVLAVLAHVAARRA